jgi:hypothetical protein
VKLANIFSTAGTKGIGEDIGAKSSNIFSEQIIKTLADVIVNSSPFEAILRIVEPVQVTISPRDPSYMILKTVDGTGFVTRVEKKFISKKVTFNRLASGEDIGESVNKFEDLCLPELYYDILEAVATIGSFNKISKDDYFYSFRALLESEAKEAAEPIITDKIEDMVAGTNHLSGVAAAMIEFGYHSVKVSGTQTEEQIEQVVTDLLSHGIHVRTTVSTYSILFERIIIQ